MKTLLSEQIWNLFLKCIGKNIIKSDSQERINTVVVYLVKVTLHFIQFILSLLFNIPKNLFCFICKTPMPK